MSLFKASWLKNLRRWKSPFPFAHGGIENLRPYGSLLLLIKLNLTVDLLSIKTVPSLLPQKPQPS